MRGKKSIYSLNKENPKGIVYPHANGESTVLTPASFANEEEFYRWKEISDSIFREERLADHIYENHIPPRPPLPPTALPHGRISSSA